MYSIVLALLIVCQAVYAQENTEIFGQARTPSGKKVQSFMVVPNDPTQNFHSENPIKQTLPEPIERKTPETSNIQPLKQINQWAKQDPKPFSISPQKEQNEIENTLYEGGNRIYDVQSYPIKDIKTITEPNLDPTISTYPEY